VVDLFLRFKPMACRHAERALHGLGFVEQRKRNSGSSHRNFKKVVNGRLRKVTLDCHKGEVAAKNVKSIISQAGVSAKEFFKAAGLV